MDSCLLIVALLLGVLLKFHAGRPLYLASKDEEGKPSFHLRVWQVVKVPVAFDRVTANLHSFSPITGLLFFNLNRMDILEACFILCIGLVKQKVRTFV